jgi:hypothetical protein
MRVPRAGSRERSSASGPALIPGRDPAEASGPPLRAELRLAAPLAGDPHDCKHEARKQPYPFGQRDHRFAAQGVLTDGRCFDARDAVFRRPFGRTHARWRTQRLYVVNPAIRLIVVAMMSVPNA